MGGAGGRGPEHPAQLETGNSSLPWRGAPRGGPGESRYGPKPPRPAATLRFHIPENGRYPNLALQARPENCVSPPHAATREGETRSPWRGLRAAGRRGAGAQPLAAPSPGMRARWDLAAAARCLRGEGGPLRLPQDKLEPAARVRMGLGRGRRGQTREALPASCKKGEAILSWGRGEGRPETWWGPGGGGGPGC